MKVYGNICTKNRRFELELAPQVRAKFRRMFLSTEKQHGKLQVSDTRPNCLDLEMMIRRWPLDCCDGTIDHIFNRAQETRVLGEEMDLVLAGQGLGPVDMLLPLREYQHIALEVLRRRGNLLLGDTVGLGKTAVAIAAAAVGMTPTIVVCQNHLVYQWRDQFRKFLGDKVKIHLQLKGTGPNPPEHDVLIMPYTMVAKWAKKLEGYRLLVLDECQELRHTGTTKYASAYDLARACGSVLGLSASPVINYGDEIHNILDLIEPDCLGPRHEFLSEWCTYRGIHHVVKDPPALGAYIAEQHLFLRRTRHDVGRELPPVNKVIIDVPFDAKRNEELSRQSLQLAQAILSSESSFNEKGQAARELDLKLRMATGIAKAPAVATAVADIVLGGEKVVVTAWHREVWDILASHFKAKGIPFWLYTGTESTKQKHDNAQAFVNSEQPGVFMMSIRSGAGLDGIQVGCSTICHAELDWSGKMHEQATGRIGRDGQEDEITEIFMIASGGSDPIIADILGIKNEQASGITDPLLSGTTGSAEEVEGSRSAVLARKILETLNIKIAA